MQLKSKQLVGLLIVVYVKRSLLSKISNVQSDAQGTGIMGVMVSNSCRGEAVDIMIRATRVELLCDSSCTTLQSALSTRTWLLMTTPLPDGIRSQMSLNMWCADSCCRTTKQFFVA